MGHSFLSSVTSCVSQDKKKKRERKGKRKVQRYGDNTKTENGQLRSTRHGRAALPWRQTRTPKETKMQKGARKQLLFSFPLNSFLLALSSRFPLPWRNTPNTCHRGQQTKWHKITLVIGANSGSSHARLDGMLIEKTFASCSHARF